MRLRRNRFCAAVLILVVSLGSGALAQGAAQDPQPSPQTTDAEKPTLTVGKAGEAQYTSVQAAIDAAPPGAIIRISPGVFSAGLTIRKPLTLQGAGWERTTLRGQPPTAEKWRELTEKTRQQLREATTDEQRRAIEVAMLEDPAFTPAVLIENAQGVRLRDLKIAADPVPFGANRAISWQLLVCSASQMSMESRALLGSPGDGMHIKNGSKVRISKCLVAAVWGVGIAALPSDAKNNDVHIADSDIRNCCYCSIRIGRGCAATIERCRISGAAWHGIRYDDASPTIKDNRIFDNARCGIYASGKTAATVSGNLFLRNEMIGISAWFQNADRIVGNTFVNNKRSAIDVLGASTPTLERNIFAEHPTAIFCSPLFKENDAQGMVMPDPVLRDNLFWNNQCTVRQRRAVGKPPKDAEIEPAEATRSLKLDPQFTDPKADIFSIAPDSPARRNRVGALDPLTFDSPFPLQPEEKAIIPDGPTREFNKWKSPAETRGPRP